MRPGAVRFLTSVASAVVVGGAVLAAATGDAVLLVAAAAASVAVAVAWTVVRHEAGTAVGPALAWSSACVVAVMVDDALVASLDTADPLPLAGLARHASVGSWPANLAGVLWLLLVFPDGPRPGRLWRGLPWLYVAATLAILVAERDARQVAGRVVGAPSGTGAVVVAVATLAVGLCLALAVAGVVVRYRRGTDRVRHQIRWLMLGGGAVVLLLFAGWGLTATGATLSVAFAPFLAGTVVLLPLAVGIAVVRYDLFDVDRLLGSSVSWLVTLVLSAAIFAAVVTAAGDVVQHVTALGPATAAFVAALTLLPLHRAVRRLVGRVVDHDRYVAVATVERFAADVRTGRRQPEDVEAVLREAQQDPGLVVLLAAPQGSPGDETWVRLDGTPGEPGAGFTLTHGDDAIAHLTLGWDSARARRRVADLARTAWVPIEVSRLRLALRDALAEATSSRARLAEATADERRRLERDLHDGAQQRIVATGLRLRLLQQHLPPEPAAEVDRAVTELQDTVAELRRLAGGLRPSRLDDGLHAALTAVRSTTPLPVELDVGVLPVVDDTRALTAYLVVTEAVANALKHARATRIRVRVAADADRLSVEVADDGVGGVPPDAPLPALRDRVLSVGGTLTVASTLGAGTTITAVL